MNSGILGAAEMLFTSDMNEDSRNNFEMIQKPAVSLRNRINDILDFSKVEAGKPDLKPVQFDLRYLVRKTLVPFEPAIHSRGLTLDVAIHSDVPEEVIGDPDRLGQILRILIENAVKSTEAGQIRIEVGPHQPAGSAFILLFALKDTGIGFPEADFPELFRRFTQIDSSYAQKYRGTGLGLAISKKLVELMGGSIRAENRTGGGAAIYIAIPFAEATMSEFLCSDPDGKSPRTESFEEEIEGFIRRGGSDLEFVKQMLAGFSEEVPRRLDQLNSALADRDTAAASRIAHTLCGLVGVMELRSMVADFRTLEQTLRRGDLAEGKRRYEEAKVLLQTVTTHIQNLPIVNP